MTRVGASLRRLDVRIPGIELPLMSVSQTRGVIRRSELTDKPPRAESLDVYKVCRAGDIVFNKMSIRAGALGVAAEDGLVTYHYEVMRPLPENDARFFVYLMKSPPFIAELVARERGIGSGDQTNVRTTEVPFSVLKTIDAFIPTLEEQRAIADFLDRETAKIDALIAKQEQFIATLREDRTATITHAVTKGLDPHVEMLETGSLWLGEIPSHWTTTKIKWVASLITSGSRGWAEYYSDEGDYFVRIGNLTRGSLGFDDSEVNRVRVPAGVEGSRTVTRSGDILFSITAYLGSVAIVDEAHAGAYVSQHVSLVRLVPGYLTPDFAGYVCLSEVGQRQLNGNAYGGTKVQLSLGDVGNLEIPVAPPAEQNEIVDFLKDHCRKIDLLTEKTKQVIATLREYRSALITDAVTGKIDVRAAA